MSSVDDMDSDVRNLYISPRDRVTSSTHSLPLDNLNTMAPRETRSFTGVLDELHNNDKTDGNKLARHRTWPDEANHLPTQIADPPKLNFSISTREKYSRVIYMIGDEVLNYKGQRFSLNDIAPVWKKDCRMWLWKSVRNARKKQRNSGKN
ncbi:unnamed protein product [Timema podura]|uniref:Uncharacterized protein n=1 Tax=Timema podura TaxID=61482 RepID=A0ABN7P1E2_TIMPD|nr:unnamed protein product [Timema podura]